MKMKGQKMPNKKKAELSQKNNQNVDWSLFGIRIENCPMGDWELDRNWTISGALSFDRIVLVYGDTMTRETWFSNLSIVIEEAIKNIKIWFMKHKLIKTASIIAAKATYFLFHL